LPSQFLFPMENSRIYVPNLQQEDHETVKELIRAFQYSVTYYDFGRVASVAVRSLKSLLHQKVDLPSSERVQLVHLLYEGITVANQDPVVILKWTSALTLLFK